MRLFAAIAISCRETKSAKTPLRCARPARSRPLQGLLFTTEITEDTEIVQQGRHAACPSLSRRERGKNLCDQCYSPALGRRGGSRLFRGRLFTGGADDRERGFQ